ncbi:MAG: DGQHR domain-containing protein [Caldilineaceae bacterium]|nr:DGQHR domain-containing protein [Caldilineaceae bacterium]
MSLISRPAVEISQGNLTLYLTFVTPDDLFNGNFYTVDALEPRTQEGYQRILDENRANRLSRHLIEAIDEGYAHLPTTIFLATDRSLDYDEETKTLSFDTDEVGPFSVVDGQHRIEGLRKAITKKPYMRDFRLPVTIGSNLDNTHQMYHFYVVNTTQVPVDPSMRQQITKRFTEMAGVEDLPYMPYWLNREIAKGSDAKALRMVEFLNEHDDSPLQGRVQMANDPKSRNKIKQSSIVSVFKSQVFVASHPLAVQETDPERAAKIMLNYFRAIDEMFVDGRDRSKTVVYKSNGIFFFLSISKWVFNSIYSSTRNFTIQSITQVIQDALNELDDEFRSIAIAEWWMSGHGASSLNRASTGVYIDAFQQALAASQKSDDIVL